MERHLSMSRLEDFENRVEMRIGDKSQRFSGSQGSQAILEYLCDLARPLALYTGDLERHGQDSRGRGEGDSQIILTGKERYNGAEVGAFNSLFEAIES